jgi:hypothetical protein
MAHAEFEGMSDKELIGTIQQSVQTELIEVDDREFTTRPIHNPPPPAKAEALTTHTLQSVIDYLATDKTFDDVIPADESEIGLAVHVVSPTHVRILGGISDRFRQREIFVVAQAIEIIGPTFAFGRYYPLEEFIISLRSLFAETDEVDSLIRILGRVEDSAVHQFDDDGVSQTVTARVGIATKADVPVPSIVMLAPFRTFPEIDQPFSNFFLRLRRGDDDEPPEAALFETDGGKWKIEAMAAIKEFLTGKTQGVAIIG